MKSLLIAIATIFALTAGASTAFAGDAAAGKALFNSKSKAGCKVCHKITAKKLVGPGLKGVMSRHTEEWVVKWLHNPKGMWTAGDKETEDMKVRLKRVGKKKTRMKFKKTVHLSDSDIDNLVAYLKTL